MLPKLSRKVLNSEPVQHAMKVYEAVALNLYNIFFKLLNDAPNMSYLFMDYVADYMRWKGLRSMTKTFRAPNELSLKYIVKQLGYKNEKIAYDALMTHGATVKKNEEDPNANSAYSLDTLNSSKIYTKQFVFKVMDGDNVDESR